MKKLILVAATTIAAVAIVASGASAAPLITNGSFENGTFVDQGNDTDSLAVGSTVMTGWTVAGSEPLAWIGPTNPYALTASDGSYFLDLTGYNNGAPYSGVTQTITTTPGATYNLTFDLGSSPGYGVPDGITASAGSTSLAFTSTNTTVSNYWQSESLTFTATGSSTPISLIGNSGTSYIGLDNVSVVETISAAPEPATWALMFLGVGGMGAAMRLAKRRNGLASASV